MRRADVNSPILTTSRNDDADDRLLRCRDILRSLREEHRPSDVGKRCPPVENYSLSTTCYDLQNDSGRPRELPLLKTVPRRWTPVKDRGQA